jgi:hypothetical protein
MRKTSLIVTWVSILALLVGGCQSGGGDQTAQNTPSPSPAIKKRDPNQPKPGTTPPFTKKPLVAKQPGARTTVAGLVPPESPENAAKRAPKGRSDPFSSIPVQPEVTVSPNPVPVTPPSPRSVPGVPPLPPLRQQGIPRTRSPFAQTPNPNTVPPLPRLPRPVTRKPSTRSPAGAAQPKPNSSPSEPVAALPPRTIPELPKLPEPTQARGVEVTGVAEVGGTPMAIIKVPGEPARYVREGQRIANGQVLVKRIEMNQGPTPVVILEQYGVEVAKAVGDKGSPSSPGAPGQPPPPPTASLPPATANQS